MTVWVEEVLFRGNPNDGTFAYHVVLGAMTVDPFTQKQTPAFQGPMTAEQAAAAGYDLGTLISGLNAAALVANTALTAQVAALQAQLDALQSA